MARIGLLAFLLCLELVLFAGRSQAQPLPPMLDASTSYIHEFDLSPDGQRLVWIALRGGERKVHVRDLFGNETQVLPYLPHLSEPHWARDNRHVYVLADQGGDENFHLMVYDTATPALPARDLTPYPGKKVVLIDVNNPDGSALVGIDLSSPGSFDVYRVWPNGRKPQLVEQGVAGRISWLTTMNGELFGHVQATEDHKLRVETTLPGQRQWQSFLLPNSDLALGNVITATSDPRPDGTVWFLMRGGLDFATPQRISLASGETVETLAPDGVDADRVIFDRDSKPLLLQSFPGYPLLRVFDPALRTLLQSVPLPTHSYFKAASSDITMTRLILMFMADNGEENLLYLDRAQGVARVIFRQPPPLSRDQMPKTLPFNFAARDQMMLHGYLTLPPNGVSANLPLVLLVHGGPWVRDEWGFDNMVIGLALQGYAVLRVNFRGSGGYGRSFENAGLGEWGGKMQDDLTDAVCWAVKQGVADPRRMAVMGGSYGGYAALMALERTPKLFAAAIEADGPVDLPSHQESLPAYAKPFLPIIQAFTGTDPATLWDRSPLAHVERIERPVLAFQGVNDPRVRKSQLESFEKAMHDAGKNITTSYVDDEGHGFYYESSFNKFQGDVFRFLNEKMRNNNTSSADTSYCLQ